MIYEFTPTQSYNGYEKPWAAGKGPNLFDLSTASPGRLTTTGAVASSTTVSHSDYVEILPDTAYYFRLLCRNNSATGICWYDSEKEFISYQGTSGSGTFSGAYTSPATAKFCRISFFTSGVTSGINYPSTLTDFYPYENSCPPEGFNMWDPEAQEFIQVYAGFVNANTRELYLRPVYPEYAGEELVGPWMSSLELYDEDTTPTEGAFVIDFGGELESFEITPFMLQTLLDSLGIRQHFTNGAGLLNSLMDQAQGRVRSEEELLHLSRPLNVIAIGDQLPAGITFKPISKNVLPGLPGKFIR